MTIVDTKVESIITVAELSKGSEKYLIKISLTDNMVLATHIKGGHAQHFAKGKRAALFATLELAKKEYSRLVQEGWTPDKSNFSEVAKEFFAKGAAGVSGIMEPAKVVPKVKKEKPETPPAPPPEKTVGDYLLATPAALAKEAAADLKDTYKKLLRIKQEKSAAA